MGHKSVRYKIDKSQDNVFTITHKYAHTAHAHTHTHTHQCPLTLDDGQEDDDDEEEEGDVEEDSVELVGVPRGVLYLVADAAPRPDPHVHVEQIALEDRGDRVCFSFHGQRERATWFC